MSFSSTQTTKNTEIRKSVFGVELDDISDEALQGWFEGALNDGFRSIVTPNPEFILLASENPSMIEIINRADLKLPDGVGLEYASIALYGESIQRQTGVDAMLRLLEVIEAQGGGTVCLLGTENEMILARAKAQLTQRFPRIAFDAIEPGKLSGGVFPDQLVARVVDARYTATFIALPMHIQLSAIQKLKDADYEGIVMGVGGAIDMIAGSLRRAPKPVSDMGMEWLWRLTLEPAKRYKRIYRAVIVFPLRVAYATLKQGILIQATARVFKSLLTFR